MLPADVLVLGGSGAGKTHYAGQLLGRMRHDRSGRLRLRPGGVQDLSKLEEVLACLEEGRAAGHTPAETWTGVRCALESADGAQVMLEWPEYAGERLFSITERRVLPPEWRALATAAKGWLLFIRPSTLQCYEDLLVRPTGLEPERTSDQNASTLEQRGWDDQAKYVELLQMLLFASARSSFAPASRPRLAVVMSCWDELEESRSAAEVFATRLPMLGAFIRSTWEQEAWSVWALSSLGRSLSQDERDEEFAAMGPEHFGYVIPPGSSEQGDDLTAPVAWLLGV